MSIPLLSRARELTPSETVDPPEMLGGFFPRGHISVIASKPGVGKTWFTLLNIKNITNDGYKCIMMNGESGFDVISQRLALLNWSIPATSAIVLCATDYPDCDGLSITSIASWKALCTLIKEYKADALFIDSLVAFIDGDESDMKLTKDVFMRLSRLASSLNIAVVVNHHLRKSTLSSSVTIDDVIGSSAISRIACCMFTMVQDGDVVVVSCQKSWYKKPSNFNFKLDYDQGLLLIRNNLGIVLEKNGPVALRTEMNGYPHEWFTSSALAEKTKLPLRTIQRYLSVLIDKGDVVSRRVGRSGIEYKSALYTSSAPVAPAAPSDTQE